MISSGGRGYSASAWRGSHPNWNGNYYYNNGSYYYDSGFSSPAIMTNEWAGIAIGVGGVAFEASLSSDPTLYFSGSVGAFYPMTTFNSDENGSGWHHLRYAYFNRPYFWRSGVRYDRVSVTSGGRSGYEFRRG